MMKRTVAQISLWLTLMVAMLSLPTSVQAAVGEAKAAIDTPMVIVGMPRMLHLEVTVPRDAKVEWPLLYKQGGVTAMDMEDPTKNYQLEFGPDTDFNIDTVAVNGDQVTMAQNLQVFAFDSAAMVVKPIPFAVNGVDTLYTPVVPLSCDQPFESVPTDPQAMQGLKDIMDPPFVLWDYLRWVVYFMIGLVVIAILAIIVYFVLKLFIKKPEEKKVAPEVLLPAHEVAMEALLDLEQKHLWQNGKFKEFHTELTDILRRYVERRYGVQALESTTDEIMEELVELQISQKSSYNNLRDILRMADLAKFAKYEPSADENQMSYYNARLFVEQTKEVIVEKQPGEAPAADEENKNK